MLDYSDFTLAIRAELDAVAASAGLRCNEDPSGEHLQLKPRFRIRRRNFLDETVLFKLLYEVVEAELARRQLVNALQFADVPIDDIELWVTLAPALGTIEADFVGETFFNFSSSSDSEMSRSELEVQAARMSREFERLLKPL